jgi:hypothetical protein
MPKLKPNTIIPTDVEEALIQTGIVLILTPTPLRTLNGPRYSLL